MSILRYNPSGPGWENGIIMTEKGKKKHLSHCNYDSAIKFEVEGVGINTIILFFRERS